MAYLTEEGSTGKYQVSLMKGGLYIGFAKKGENIEEYLPLDVNHLLAFYEIEKQKKK